ncbi:unnamed protein product [Amoebophrya sp. A120]|nr:unnamed protein product [Amoebophrya sp. A120]|eukprot:GSA120T00016676001.1
MPSRKSRQSETAPLIPPSGLSRISYKSHKSILQSHAESDSDGSSRSRGSLSDPGAGFGRTTTWWESIFSIVTTAIGAGIVTLPSVFQSTGYVPAIFILAFCTAASIVAAIKKAQVMQRIEDLNVDQEDMSQMGSLTKVLFGKCWAAVYSKFYHTFIILVGTVFMLLLAMNFVILFDYIPALTKNGWIVTVALILTFLCWLRDVSVLARVSFVAWLSCIVVILVVALNSILNPAKTGDDAMVAFNGPAYTESASLLKLFAGPQQGEVNDYFGRTGLTEVGTDSARGVSENPDISSGRKLQTVSQDANQPAGGKFVLDMKAQPFDVNNEYLDFPKWAPYRSCEYGQSCLLTDSGKVELVKMSDTGKGVRGEATLAFSTGGNADGTVVEEHKFPATEAAFYTPVAWISGQWYHRDLTQNPPDTMPSVSARRITLLKDAVVELSGTGIAGEVFRWDTFPDERDSYYFETNGEKACEFSWYTSRKADSGRTEWQGFLEYLRVAVQKPTDGSAIPETLDVDADFCERNAKANGNEFNSYLIMQDRPVEWRMQRVAVSDTKQKLPVVSALDLSQEVSPPEFVRNKLSYQYTRPDGTVAADYTLLKEIEQACLNPATPENELVCAAQEGVDGCWLTRMDNYALYYWRYPALPKNTDTTTVSDEDRKKAESDRAKYQELCAAASRADALPADVELLTIKVAGLTEKLRHFHDSLSADERDTLSWQEVTRERALSTANGKRDALQIMSSAAKRLPQDIVPGPTAIGVDRANNRCTLEYKSDATTAPFETLHFTYIVPDLDSKSQATQKPRKVLCAEAYTADDTASWRQQYPAYFSSASTTAGVVNESADGILLDLPITNQLVFPASRTENISGWSSTIASLSWIVAPVNKVFFSFTFVMMIPALYTSMVEPSTIVSSILMSSFTIAFIYFVVGICGYLTYGSAIDSSIVDSMRHDFVNPANHRNAASWQGITVALMIVVNVFISFALIMNSTLLHLEMKFAKVKTVEDVPPGKSKVCRTLIIWMAALIVWVVPFFGQLVDLVAAFGCVLTQVPYPLLAYAVVYKTERSLGERIFHWVLLVIAAIQIIYGAGTAFVALGTDGVDAMKTRFGLVEIPVFQPLPTGNYKFWSFILDYQYFQS